MTDLRLAPDPDPPEDDLLALAHAVQTVTRMHGYEAGRVAAESVVRLWDDQDAECGCGHMLSSHLGGVPGGECLARGCRCAGWVDVEPLTEGAGQ